MKQLISKISNRNLFKLLILSAFLLLGLFFLYIKTRIKPVEGWDVRISILKEQKTKDQHIKDYFLASRNQHSNFERYNHLFNYFVDGYLSYKTTSGALTYYTGEISTRGRKINALEGFARFFPLASVWFSTGKDYLTVDNKNINLKEIIREAILSGTDPNNPDYWGTIQNKDQRIVEAADIALGLWLSKDQIWVTYSDNEKYQVIDWLSQALDREIDDNNWNLFPITIYKVMESLGFKDYTISDKINALYHRYKKKHYLGSGWFDDPPKGIDYYNAWSIHYSLFWIDQIDPEYDHTFIKNSHAEFLSFYKYFFGEKGFPIMGRSVCYRLAAPGPMLSGALLVPEEISPGLAFRSFDLTWRHFIANGALENGKVTQGIYRDDLSLLDSYSGAGSCLWSLRSFIIAIYVNQHVPLWNADEEKLPVEVADYSLENPTIGWLIQGNQGTGNITLKILANKSHNRISLKQYSLKNQLKEIFFQRPFRPKNQDMLYKNHTYSTQDLPYHSTDKK